MLEAGDTFSTMIKLRKVLNHPGLVSGEENPEF